MTQKKDSKLSVAEIDFRPAEPADAKAASRLLFDSFPKMATFIIGLSNQDRAKEILKRMFTLPGHRFSYENAVIAQHQGRIAGMYIALSGSVLGKSNRRLGKLVLHQYRAKGKNALIIRAWPLVFIKEAGRDEYLLSNLAVKKSMHGKGVDRSLLSHFEDEASQAGCSKVALMIPIDDKQGRQFFEENGYKVKAIHLESNRRVPYLGAGYQRMVKELNE